MRGPDNCAVSRSPPPSDFRPRRNFRPSRNPACPASTSRPGTRFFVPAKTPPEIVRKMQRRHGGGARRARHQGQARAARRRWSSASTPEELAAQLQGGNREMGPDHQGRRHQAEDEVTCSLAAASPRLPPRLRSHPTAHCAARARHRHRAWPNRIVKLVVPFTPGGGIDADRPHRRRAAVRDVGPAGRGREQAGRRRQHRLRNRRPLRPRRLHHVHHRRRARGQPLPVPVDQLRSDCRLRAGHADLPLPQPPGGAERRRRSARSPTSSRRPRRTRARSPSRRRDTAARRT